jgi:hypothetical protein
MEPLNLFSMNRRPNITAQALTLAKAHIEDKAAQPFGILTLIKPKTQGK